MITEISNLSVSILLSCVVGEDISKVKINFWERGRLVQKDLSYCLRETFTQMVDRLALPHISLFPQLLDVYITPHERDILANCRTIRGLVLDYVNKRRAELQSGAVPKQDLLTLMLTDMKWTDERALIDELLTVFFAGSQTTAVVTENLIMYLQKSPESARKLLDEIDA